MTIQRLAAHLADEADTDNRWLLLLEFLEEYEHEPASRRRPLAEAEPASTNDARWDALLAGIVDWLAARDGFPAPSWVETPERTLPAQWSPHQLASLRRLAAEHTPPEIRRHGVLIDPYDLARA
ncbi:MAG: hypothetical protein ACYCO3_09535 [Mycobacteriales bacterium]